MRPLLIILTLATAAHARSVTEVWPIGPFVNDTGYRWELGERFDITRPVEQQDGLTGSLKDFRTGRQPNDRGEVFDAWSLTVTRSSLSIFHGILGTPWARNIADNPRPRPPRYTVMLAAATADWALDLGDNPTIIAKSPGISGGLAGYIQLQKVGYIDIGNNRLLPDYQPVAWGYTRIPEPSSMAIALAASAYVLCCRGKRQTRHF